MNDVNKELVMVLLISIFVSLLYIYYCASVNTSKYNQGLNDVFTLVPVFFFLTLPIAIRKYQIVKNGGKLDGE